MEQMQVEGHLLTVASSGKVVMQVAQLRGQIYNYCKCFQLVTKQIGSFVHCNWNVTPPGGHMGLEGRPSRTKKTDGELNGFGPGMMNEFTHK